jgi:hypothetical protein
MRTLTQLNYAINSLLVGGPATNDEEVREAFERLKLVQARVKIENGDAEPKDIATVHSFFTRVLEKFHHPE